MFIELPVSVRFKISEEISMIMNFSFDRILIWQIDPLGLSPITIDRPCMSGKTAVDFWSSMLKKVGRSKS